MIKRRGRPDDDAGKVSGERGCGLFSFAIHGARAFTSAALNYLPTPVSMMMDFRRCCLGDEGILNYSDFIDLGRVAGNGSFWDFFWIDGGKI